MRGVLRCLSLALLLLPWGAYAAQVQVIALTNGKATLVIDNGRPRTMSAGDVSPEGVRLVAATAENAVVEVDGKRRTLALGTSYRAAPSAEAGAASGRSVVLSADSQGHFMTTGMINGIAAVQFLVDTGASLVSISVDDARRAGINYLSGQRAMSRTASGIAPIYLVKLDMLKVGDITVYNVDAAVHTSGQLPVGLLGMSFLNRMEMKRDGAALTLIRRF